MVEGAHLDLQLYAPALCRSDVAADGLRPVLMMRHVLNRCQATTQENTTHSCGQPHFLFPEYGYLATLNLVIWAIVMLEE